MSETFTCRPCAPRLIHEAPRLMYEAPQYEHEAPPLMHEARGTQKPRHRQAARHAKTAARRLRAAAEKQARKQFSAPAVLFCYLPIERRMAALRLPRTTSLPTSL